MFQDCRSQKVALLSNCLLNQNAKVVPCNYPAVVPNLMRILEQYEFGIQQMPCPETYAIGIRRFWACYEQYNTRGVRRNFEQAADFLLDEVEDFLAHGFKVILIGIDGSPSCGVTITDKNDEWMGGPTLSEESVSTENYTWDEGSGVFIEMIQKKIQERGYPQLPSFGLGLDLMGQEPDFAGLEAFVKANA